MHNNQAAGFAVMSSSSSTPLTDTVVPIVGQTGTVVATYLSIDDARAFLKEVKPVTTGAGELKVLFEGTFVKVFEAEPPKSTGATPRDSESHIPGNRTVADRTAVIPVKTISFWIARI